VNADDRSPDPHAAASATTSTGTPGPPGPQHVVGPGTLGSFVVSIGNGDYSWTPGCAHLLMLDGDGDGDGDGTGSERQFRSGLHADDKARVKDTIEAAIRQRIAYAVHYRNARGDELVERGTLTRDGEGSRLRGEGVVALVMTDAVLRGSARRERGLARLKQMSGRHAHDVNNKLGVTLGNLDLLRLKSTDPVANRRIDAAIDACQQAADLNGKVLHLTKPEAAAPKRMDLRQAVRDLSLRINAIAGVSVEVVYQFTADRCNVELALEELESVVCELVSNAVEAMPSGGSLRIEIQPGALVTGEATVNLSFADTGADATTTALERALAPGSTTRSSAGAQGFGLSMVSEFAVRARGEFSLRCAPDGGVIAVLRVPACADASGEDHYVFQPDVGEPVSVDEPASGRILVVDDDLPLAEATSQILLAAGYSVSVATSAHEALALLEIAPVDLVFSDIVMRGGMNGIALARAVETRFPGTAVVLTSGFTAGDDDPEVASRAFLNKPFSRVRLLEVIAKHSPTNES
jgi:signal transduction histidine kinase/CheY-like chemotaxis protein